MKVPEPQKEKITFLNPNHWSGHPRFYGLLNEIAKLHSDKNSDYTVNYPLENLKLCEDLMGISAVNGVAVRLTDKFSRLSSFIKKGELTIKEESVMDTLKDMAVYALLGIILLEEEKEQE